jgi:divalent metal cation (Fe/Co/Zn/Cd) transporter
MKRISTLFEIIVSAALLFLGLYMLYEGSSNKSTNEAAILIGGAVCFTLSIMTLVSAVKSLVWHRRMLRHSMPNDDLHTSSPEHNHGWWDVSYRHSLGTELGRLIDATTGEVLLHIVE